MCRFWMGLPLPTVRRLHLDFFLLWKYDGKSLCAIPLYLTIEKVCIEVSFRVLRVDPISRTTSPADKECDAYLVFGFCAVLRRVCG